MARVLNRPWETPDYPGPAVFKTYQILAPIRTHRRPATCAEVDCVKRARGFRAQFDVSTVQGRDNASYIERCGLRFTREVTGSMVTYTFPAGQNCFDKHSVSLQREPLYVVRGGDHRGNPRNIPRVNHRNARSWVDDFGEHQETIIAQQRRG